ncbi:DciA family protein [Streptomyces sp. NBC_01483]|uniref:DciA family protein n=1 Tax=Streptomyces sp. NBC_01483 TaxID=2903883 RepID=UPI002E36A553|nr:DciA family protein [Streptomyces sp. NBC_01483]
MPEPEQKPSGLDLAREALAEYKKRTWALPTNAPARKPKPKRFVRTGDRRDPVPLLDAIANLGADIPLEAGLAGGNVIDQWATLCPQYAGLVQPVHYDEHTGRLDLRPGSHSYAAQLRLLGGQLAKQINDKMGRPVVRTIRVLPVGNVATAERPAAAPESAAPEAPVRTRETASDGYRRTLDAHQAVKADGEPTNPYVVDAIERQDRALSDLRNREPEEAFTDAVAEIERLTAPAVDRAEQIRRAAIARKRGGNDAAPVRRAFDVA